MSSVQEVQQNVGVVARSYWHKIQYILSLLAHDSTLCTLSILFNQPQTSNKQLDKFSNKLSSYILLHHLELAACWLFINFMFPLLQLNKNNHKFLWGNWDSRAQCLLQVSKTTLQTDILAILFTVETITNREYEQVNDYAQEIKKVKMFFCFFFWGLRDLLNMWTVLNTKYCNAVKYNLFQILSKPGNFTRL